MTTAHQAEQADNDRLKKSQEAIDYYRQKESEALRELALIRQSLATVREKHRQLFEECENRAAARRKAGLIEYTPGY